MACGASTCATISWRVVATKRLALDRRSLSACDRVRPHLPAPRGGSARPCPLLAHDIRDCQEGPLGIRHALSDQRYTRCSPRMGSSGSLAGGSSHKCALSLHVGAPTACRNTFPFHDLRPARPAPLRSTRTQETGRHAPTAREQRRAPRPERGGFKYRLARSRSFATRGLQPRAQSCGGRNRPMPQWGRIALQRHNHNGRRPQRAPRDPTVSGRPQDAACRNTQLSASRVASCIGVTPWSPLRLLLPDFGRGVGEQAGTRSREGARALRERTPWQPGGGPGYGAPKQRQSTTTSVVLPPSVGVLRSVAMSTITL